MTKSILREAVVSSSINGCLKGPLHSLFFKRHIFVFVSRNSTLVTPELTLHMENSQTCGVGYRYWLSIYSRVGAVGGKSNQRRGWEERKQTLAAESTSNAMGGMHKQVLEHHEWQRQRCPGYVRRCYWHFQHVSYLLTILFSYLVVFSQNRNRI